MSQAGTGSLLARRTASLFARRLFLGCPTVVAACRTLRRRFLAGAEPLHRAAAQSRNTSPTKLWTAISSFILTTTLHVGSLTKMPPAQPAQDSQAASGLWSPPLGAAKCVTRCINWPLRYWLPLGVNCPRSDLPSRPYEAPNTCFDPPPPRQKPLTMVLPRYCHGSWSATQPPPS